MLVVFGVLAVRGSRWHGRQVRARAILVLIYRADCGNSRAVQPALKGNVLKFCRFAKSHDSGNIFRSGTESALMVATIEELLQSGAAFDVQRADSFRCVYSVAG